MEGSGGGTGTVPYKQDGYKLAYRPLLELPGLLLRWRTSNPYLWVRYEQGKLVSAVIN